MALVTRCPICGTLFKVVPDQLRISEGWVRCGHCAEIFDASSELHQSDLAHDPVVVLADEPSFSANESAELPLVAGVEVVDEDTFTTHFASSGDELQIPRAVDLLVADGSEVQPSGTVVDAYPYVNVDDGAGVEPAPVVKLQDESTHAVPDLNTVPVANFAEADYSFAKTADATATAQPAWKRWVWIGSGLVLLVALVWQGLVQGRDQIVAAWPEARPVVQALCMPTGCKIHPLKRIDAVVIDSSTLSNLPNEDAYRLHIVLKNQGDVDLAMPAIECVFTDINEQPVFRRVLSAAELGAASRALFAKREWSTTVDLRIGDDVGKSRIVGYRLLVFYP